MRLRILVLSVLVLAGLSWPTASQADGVDPSASIGSTITCDSGTGTVEITLTAGSADVTFAYWGTHEGFESSDDVAAGETKTTTVFLPNKSDVVSVGIVDPESDDYDLASATVVATATLRARCDEAPYTNVGVSYSACESHVDLYIQNQSTAYDPDRALVPDPTNDPGDVSGPDALQPVTFTISAKAADGTLTVLDTFVLDVATQNYQRAFSGDDLGEATAVVIATSGTTDDREPDTIEVNPDGCVSGGPTGVVVPTSAAVPDTGY